VDGAAEIGASGVSPTQRLGAEKTKSRSLDGTGAPQARGGVVEVREVAASGLTLFQRMIWATVAFSARTSSGVTSTNAGSG
jgi:hypothetical protein